MHPSNKDLPRNEASPLDMRPESVEEANLQATLRILVASGKITKEDVMMAWKLAFSA